MINIALLAPAVAAFVAAFAIIAFSHRLRNKARQSIAAARAKEQPAE
jgi:hypothetical protein